MRNQMTLGETAQPIIEEKVYRPIAIQVHRCLQLLASACDGAIREDGQGFNQPDSQWGKSMAMSDPRSWGLYETQLAYFRVYKYKTQLEDYGVAFDRIPKPYKLSPLQVMQFPRIAVLRKAVVVLQWNYNDKSFGQIKTKVKQIRESRYLGNGQGWQIPAYLWDSRILPIVKQFGFTLDGDPGTLIKTPPQSVRPVYHVKDRKVVLCGDKIGIQWDKQDDQFPELYRFIKTIQGNFWNKALFQWEISIGQLQSVLPFLQRIGGFKFDQAVLELAKDQATSEKDSHAKDGESLDISTIISGHDKIRGYQHVGISYAVQHKRLIIADSMGLGKTVESIVTVSYLRKFPVLVICPKSAKLKWQQEINLWTPGKTSVVLSGQTPYSVPQVDYVIINYDVLRFWVDALKKVKFQAIVIDEAHKLKNAKALRTKAAKKLVKKQEVIIEMTGTPIENRVNEYIELLKILGRFDELFGNWQNFVREFCAAKLDFIPIKKAIRIKQRAILDTVLPEFEKGQRSWNTDTVDWVKKGTVVGQFTAYYLSCPYKDEEGKALIKKIPESRWNGEKRAHMVVPGFKVIWDTSGSSNMGKLNRILRQHCYIRRKKAEVLPELPPKMFVDIPVELSNMEEYRLAEAEEVEWFAINPVNKENRAEALVRLNKLRQLVGFGKIEAAQDWIENFLESEEEEKLVIFGYHIKVQEELYKAMKRGTAVHYFGKDSEKKREEARQKFQTNPKYRVMAASVSACQMAIELHAAAQAIFVEYLYSPKQMEQAQDRLHRIGQTKTVFIYNMHAAGTIDDWFADMLAAKAEIFKQAADGAPLKGYDPVKALGQFLANKVK
jgi:superfamily II DNA or RNA helicase